MSVLDSDRTESKFEAITFSVELHKKEELWSLGFKL
jgi:hypothetical protein